MLEVHDVAQLAAIRHVLRLYFESYSLPAEVTYALLTCTQEASKNALRYAASPWGVQISVSVWPDEILVTVADHGAGLDLAAATGSQPDPMSESGRGLFLLRSLMDVVEFRVAGGTEVRMRKALPPVAPADSHAA